MLGETALFSGVGNLMRTWRRINDHIPARSEVSLNQGMSQCKSNICCTHGVEDVRSKEQGQSVFSGPPNKVFWEVIWLSVVVCRKSMPLKSMDFARIPS